LREEGVLDPRQRQLGAQSRPDRMDGHTLQKNRAPIAGRSVSSNAKK
jgi:hypothetical protein